MRQGKPGLKPLLQTKLTLNKEVLAQIQAGMLPAPGDCSGTCPNACLGGHSEDCTNRVSCASRCTKTA